mmetsp:Transcript_7662/g.11480  ORF Transcript_7662/g.11480 Transcript_7662/m.11480 type:complete len:222 (+) Transcript_7662:63-728(+)
MMKFAILAAAAGSAAAFAPSPVAQTSTALGVTAAQKDFFGITSVDYSKALGVQAPLGFFDPLGLLTDADTEAFDDLREKEIKHGRVAMLAVTGFVQVELFGPAPGCEAATLKCQTDAFWQIWNSHPQYIAAGLIMITFIEAVSGIAATSGRESGDRAPGDFGLDPLGYLKGDPEKAARLQAQEIANGRLAMWAAAGLIGQGCSNHLGGVEALTQSLNDNMF